MLNLYVSNTLIKFKCVVYNCIVATYSSIQQNTMVPIRDIVFQKRNQFEITKIIEKRRIKEDKCQLKKKMRDYTINV